MQHSTGLLAAAHLGTAAVAEMAGAPSGAVLMMTLPEGDAPGEEREARAHRKGSSDAALGGRHSWRCTRMLPRSAQHAQHASVGMASTA